jgi:hypothetical protein
MEDLVTQFTTGIATATPYIVGVFGSMIGLAFLIGLGYFILGRIRGVL